MARPVPSLALGRGKGGAIAIVEDKDEARSPASRATIMEIAKEIRKINASLIPDGPDEDLSEFGVVVGEGGGGGKGEDELFSDTAAPTLRAITDIVIAAKIVKTCCSLP